MCPDLDRDIFLLMSNTQSNIKTIRTPRLNGQQIEASKAAAALAPESVAKITSRFVDMIDPVRFDKALQLVMHDDDSGSLSGNAYAVRLKIEDIVVEAREAAIEAIATAKPKPTSKKVAEVKTTERALQAVELRKQGMTLQAIADALGFKCRQGARSAILRTAGTVDPT